MKRFFVFFAALTSLFVFSYCNAPQKSAMSNQHYQYGLKVLEIVDQYLDYDISAEDAYNQLGEVIQRDDSLPDAEYGSNESLGNLKVESEAIFMHSHLLDLKYESTTEDYESLLQSRNELAGVLGKSGR